MKQFLTIIVISLFIVACNGHKGKPTADLNVAIETQANRMIRLLKAKDYPGFMNTLYPRFIENFGGKDKLLQCLIDTWGQFDKQSMMIDTVTFSAPNKIIDTGNELQTTMVEWCTIHNLQGKLKIKTTIIAISSDNGETWYFVNSQTKNLKELQTKLPNLSDSLIIAKNENPVTLKN